MACPGLSFQNCQAGVMFRIYYWPLSLKGKRKGNDMKRKKTKEKYTVVYRKRDRVAYLYLLPWLLGLVALQLFPFFSSLYYSFTNYKITGGMRWIGFDNYVRLFTIDADFKTSLKATVLYTIYTVPFKLIMALAIAMFVNRDLKGINLIRTLYYIPSLFGGSVAIAVLWKLMFLDNGVVNAFLTKLGFPVIQFWGNPKYALKTICSLEIWQFGSSMVMFLAALKNVPRGLYEAAEIDGAGKIAKFVHITLPQISPIIFFTLIMQTVSALQNFTSAFVITKGGPLKSTYVLGMMLYKEGFAYFNMGYASAISWVIFVMIVVVTLILFRSSSVWVFYEDGGR